MKRFLVLLSVLVTSVLFTSPLSALSPAMAAQTASVIASPQAYGLSGATTQAAPQTLPYSAVRETHRSSTLADGTHIEVDPVKTKIYRDSNARERQEIYVKIHRDGVVTEELSAISIIDPVAGKSYDLSPRTRTASIHDITLPKARVAAPSEGSGQTLAVATAADSAPAVVPKVERRSEDLGTRTDSGLTLIGSRSRSTYPVGSIGNDREIVVTRTNWTSQELGIEMLVETHDPRVGNTTTQVTLLSRDEPDASLFVVPPDYTIIEVPAQQ